MEEQPQTSSLSNSNFSWKKIVSVFSRQKNRRKTPPSSQPIELQKISRTVGIEDIDHTWVFEEDQHNMAMCASFKNAGIIHHFFCSDMGFADREIETRIKLKEELEKTGLIIHGILTPSDYAWHIDPTILKNFCEECLKSDIDFSRNRNTEKIYPLLAREEFESIKKLINGDLSGQVQPGTAFNEVCANRQLKERAFHSKWITSLVCCGFGSEKSLEDGTRAECVKRPGIKGLLVRSLLLAPPDFASDFIFFDDKPTETEDVRLESANGDETKTPISAVHCPFEKLEKCTQAFYDHHIAEHTKRMTKKTSSASLTKNPENLDPLNELPTEKPGLKTRMSSKSE